MSDQRIVLCVSNSYEKKFYLDPEFQSLPRQVKEELKIMCVLYTEDVGGILSLEYDGEGKLQFVVQAKDDDFFFDEIGSVLKMKQMREDKKELLEELEIYLYLSRR